MNTNADGNFLLRFRLGPYGDEHEVKPGEGCAMSRAAQRARAPEPGGILLELASRGVTD